MYLNTASGTRYLKEREFFIRLRISKAEISTARIAIVEI